MPTLFPKPAPVKQAFPMPKRLEGYARIALILLCDISNSMMELGFHANRTKLDLVVDAICQLLGFKREHRAQDLLAVVSYTEHATLVSPFRNVSRDYGELLDAARSLLDLDHGGTHMNTGLMLALDLLRYQPSLCDDPRGQTLIHVVAYSDGHDANVPAGLAAADTLKDLGCLVETFGIAARREDVNEAFLKQVATTDQDNICHYRFLADGSHEDLNRAFRNIAMGSLIIEE